MEMVLHNSLWRMRRRPEGAVYRGLKRGKGGGFAYLRAFVTLKTGWFGLHPLVVYPNTAQKGFTRSSWPENGSLLKAFIWIVYDLRRKSKAFILILYNNLRKLKAFILMLYN